MEGGTNVFWVKHLGVQSMKSLHEETSISIAYISHEVILKRDSNLEKMTQQKTF
jgi:hypothetical protein